MYYGYKIAKYKRFSIKGYAGLGLFSIETADKITTQSLALPLKILPQIQLGERFTLGINLGLNYNRLAPFSTGGLSLMWTPKPPDQQPINRQTLFNLDFHKKKKSIQKKSGGHRVILR